MPAKNLEHLGSNLGGSGSGFDLVKGKQAKTLSNEKNPVQGTEHGAQAEATVRLTQNPVFPIDNQTHIA